MGALPNGMPNEIPDELQEPGYADARNPVAAQEPTRSLPVEPLISAEELRRQASAVVSRWQHVPRSATHVTVLPGRLKALRTRLQTVLKTAHDRVSGKDLTPQLEFVESGRMFQAVITSTEAALTSLEALPHIQASQGELPRLESLAEEYLSAAAGIWSPDSLTTFVGEAQQQTPLQLAEVLLLPVALKLSQLEFIVATAEQAFAAASLPPIEQSPFSAPIHSLRRLNQYEWRHLLESMIPFDAILREDPAGAFAGMEDETRQAYYTRIAELAKNANHSETQTARAAIDLAQAALRAGDTDPRRARRTAHVGYYLSAEGLPALERVIGYHAPFAVRFRALVRRHNDDVYVFGILLLSILLIALIVAPLVPRHAFLPVIGAMFLVLLPATGVAVDLVNSLVHSLFKAESLPKMDFSEGVPAEAKTIVVVPTLLLRQDQVQELFQDLEAHYLSNEDPNIHFALLTDLPDAPVQPSPDEFHPLILLAIRLTEDLNAKYANGKGGSFLLLHRHRIYNARQGVWMGWERKRGKLLDLNKLLLSEADSFPIKSGPRSALEGLRYVITLDSDTKLPPSTAARLAGTLAHPLNQAIIDPHDRIVTVGYGILQPRVGISVASAMRSKLASLYSGETGFDIYTRAVSDAYQDLFGEGIFTGKGIYEVSVLHQVLERRFPRDSLLSHDLIEGAYVRAGLVTDIEIIDDYPSHYDAHTRRKHRWIRGDWQILRWLFSPVPDESGHMVPNPISLVSQWKILDNLRRSLVEPVTFLVLILGWFLLPGSALYWTVVIVVLLLLPAVVQLCIDLAGAVVRLSFGGIRGAFTAFAGSLTFFLINLLFLAHQALLSLDAIGRALIRSLFSGRHLLEWETAAQAEASRERTFLNLYLAVSPLLALALGAGLAWLRPHALYAAGPILFLWLIAPLAARWLSSSPTRPEYKLNQSDRTFLMRQSLLLWRFYADFGGADNHWLIPDNVEEKDLLQVRKLSPTNLGMLLNARQAACELGFLTVPEFVHATRGTLTTYDRLEKLRGHIYNWYDIETLQPIPPFTISAVDSGNLAASFYTLHSGALEMFKRPLLEEASFAGLNAGPNFDQPSGSTAASATLRETLRTLFEQYGATSQATASDTNHATAETWLTDETRRRGQAIVALVDDFLPWLRPEFEPLQELDALKTSGVPSPENAFARAEALSSDLSKIGESSSLHALARQLQARLPSTLDRLLSLAADLETIIAQSEQFAEQMDYSFLFVEARQLLSIGYDGATHELHSACYDLLASEARIASFLAVAKGDIPQQAWFRLDRSHVLVNGRATLVSWTGTMFEYMMPALWMRTFPNTLLANSLASAVRIQRDHVGKIPWGISESGFVTPQSSYGYQAFGIPGLALKYGAEDGPVISPYSTFLALPLLRKESLHNLRRMAEMGWTGDYGFFEAADYTEAAASGGKLRRNTEPRLVRSWMAHHQGMALLAATNLLHANIVQRWFHATPRVRAAELLLNEKALSKATLNELAQQSKSTAAAN